MDCMVRGFTKSRTRLSHFLLITFACYVKSTLPSDPWVGTFCPLPVPGAHPGHPRHSVRLPPGPGDGVLLCEDRTASGGQEQDL